MTTRRNRPINITDAPEWRDLSARDFEFRDDSEDSNILHLEGYASTFQPYEMYGGPANGGWTEQLDCGAFDKTLREKPDLHLLINHAGMPLARTKSGTLQLSADSQGLKVTAQLDKRDPEVQALGVKMARGDMDEMSFAFRVKGQKWESTPEFEDDPQALRTITEVSLHKGDVSVVNWGANPTTHAEVKSAIDALEVLANADQSEFAEIRSNSDLLARARVKLEALMVGTSDEEEEVEETADQRWERYAAAIAEGVMSVNDIRKLEGLAPAEEAEESERSEAEAEETEREEEIEEVSEEREITVESILADIDSAGLLDQFVEAIRELLGTTEEEREEAPEGEERDDDEEDDSEDDEDDEEMSDDRFEEETEAESKGISLRYALALLEDD